MLEAKAIKTLLIKVCVLYGMQYLSACLPHTGEVKQESEGYWLDVSKLGHASVRYRDSGGKEKIIAHNIARLVLHNKSVSLSVLADTPQLLQAGTSEQQELTGIKTPALAVENFYVISKIAFYMQSNDGKRYYCRLQDIPLGSKQQFSLEAEACEENGEEPDYVYVRHHYKAVTQKLSEKILQIDCHIKYGAQEQGLRLAVQNGTVIDDSGSYAFVKRAGKILK